MSLFALVATLPDDETIRRTAQEVVQRPEFQIRPTHSARPLWDMLWRILRPVFRFFSQLWDISPPLAITIMIVLSVICVALIAHIIYMFKSALAQRRELGGPLGLESRKVDPFELERQAEDAAAREEYISAVRLLFRAALLRIAQRERRELRPGMTNREYVQRYRQAKFAAALGDFVEVIDAKWYGHGQCDLSDYQTCRRAHNTICQIAEAPSANRP